jgi:phosphoglycolate phosphatase/putative hydrolase of the HAD superfamily
MSQHEPITAIFKKTKLVIFDLDGTIYDQKKLRKRLFITFLFNLLLLRITIKDLKIVKEFRIQREKHKGYASSSLVEDQYAWCTAKTHASIVRIRKTVEKMMYKMPLKFLNKTVYPNFISFVNALKASGHKIAIYSDYPAEEKLSALGVVADQTFCSTDKNISQLKPSEKGLIVICKSFQCDIENALFIGDREDTDGRSARMAGIQFLKVNCKEARKGTYYDNLIKTLENDR